MSTPLYHPLRQAIAAMARTTDALVELARRIDETGLGPANEGRGIGDATPNSEVFATQGATSPSPAPADDVEMVRRSIYSSGAYAALGRIAARLAQQDAALQAEYDVRRMVLHALEGQGLPRVLPDKGHGVITDAHALYERMVAAEGALREARRLTPELVERAAKMLFAQVSNVMAWEELSGATQRKFQRAARVALLAAGFQEDENG